jgi:hypothetical protein
MDVKEIGWDHVEWIHLAQERGQWRTLANTVMYKYYDSGHYWSSCVYL